MSGIVDQIVDDLTQFAYRAADKFEVVEIEISYDTWSAIEMRFGIRYNPEKVIRPKELMGKPVRINSEMDEPYAFKVQPKKEKK